MALIDVAPPHGDRRPRLVALRALGLGDLLTAVPALRALAAAFGGHDRVLVAPAGLTPLVSLLDGAVHRVADADFRSRVGAVPHVGPVDVAVNLHGRGPQSHRSLRATRPARLLAFAHPDVDRGRDAPPWRSDEHERVRWCRLLRAFDVPADAGEYRLRRPDVPRTGLRGTTVLHPGASAPSRRWPVTRWSAVACAELARGRSVVVTGGPDEVALAKAVAADAGIGGQWVAAGRTGVLELATLVADAGRVVCGDTGVAHLATAMGTPSVVLFGPTDPARWGPPTTDRHRVLWHGTTGDPHADRVDAGLLRVTVADVVEALDRLPA